MKYSKKAFVRSIPILLAITFCSCQRSIDDQTIKSTVDSHLQGDTRFEGVNTIVDNGLVILNGDCNGPGCATSAEIAVRKAKHVSFISNRIQQHTVFNADDNKNTFTVFGPAAEPAETADHQPGFMMVN